MALLQFTNQGILVKSKSTTLLLGANSTEEKVDGTIFPDGRPEKQVIGDISIEKYTAGVILRLPDSTIEYIHTKMNARDAKNHKCDVLILATPQLAEKMVEAIKPNLAIIPGATLDKARELNKQSGVQTIKADNGAVVDLSDYNAHSKQSRLTA